MIKKFQERVRLRNVLLIVAHATLIYKKYSSNIDSGHKQYIFFFFRQNPTKAGCSF